MSKFPLLPADKRASSVINTRLTPSEHKAFLACFPPNQNVSAAVRKAIKLYTIQTQVERVGGKTVVIDAHGNEHVLHIGSKTDA